MRIFTSTCSNTRERPSPQPTPGYLVYKDDEGEAGVVKRSDTGLCRAGGPLSTGRTIIAIFPYDNDSKIRAQTVAVSASVVCKSGEVKEYQFKPNHQFSVGNIVTQGSYHYGDRVALILHINRISSVATMLIGSKGNDEAANIVWGCEEQVPQKYIRRVESKVCPSHQKHVLSILDDIRFITSIGSLRGANPPVRLKVSTEVLSSAFELVCKKAMADHPIQYASDEAPSEYKCPIGSRLMYDPVVTADGTTYERENIYKWLITLDNSTSPKTKQELSNKALIPNLTLISLMQHPLVDCAPANVSDFICPISGILMQDPVVASDGHTYERVKLEELLNKSGKSISPKTGGELNKQTYVPNIAIKELIADCAKKQKGKAPSAGSQLFSEEEYAHTRPTDDSNQQMSSQILGATIIDGHYQ